MDSTLNLISKVLFNHIYKQILNNFNIQINKQYLA